MLAAAGQLDDAVLTGLAFECRGHIAEVQRDFDAATAWHARELSTWMDVGSRRQQAWAYRHLAHAARSKGDLVTAIDLAERALAAFPADDVASAAHVRNTVADVARLQGDRDEAARIYEEALSGFLSIGDRRCVASVYKNLGQMAAERHDQQAALDLFMDSIRLRHKLGDRVGVAECLEGVAGTAVAFGRFEDAVVLVASAGALRDVARAGALQEDRPITESVVASAADALDPERFTRAWAAGEELDVDAAVAWAATVAPASSPSSFPY